MSEGRVQRLCGIDPVTRKLIPLPTPTIDEQQWEALKRRINELSMALPKGKVWRR